MVTLHPGAPAPALGGVLRVSPAPGRWRQDELAVKLLHTLNRFWQHIFTPREQKQQERFLKDLTCVEQALCYAREFMNQEFIKDMGGGQVPLGFLRTRASAGKSGMTGMTQVAGLEGPFPDGSLTHLSAASSRIAEGGLLGDWHPHLQPPPGPGLLRAGSQF